MKIDRSFFEKEEFPLHTKVKVVCGGAGAYGADGRVGYVCTKAVANAAQKWGNYGGEIWEREALIYVETLTVKDEGIQSKVWGLCKGYKLEKLA